MSKVQIQVATSYDGSGVQSANADLDRYKQAVQLMQDEHNRRLNEAQRMRHDVESGEASQEEARRVLSMLDDRVRRTRELVDMHGVILDRSRAIRAEQDRAVASGNAGEVARLQREIEALAEVRRYSRRDPTRLESELYAERARVVRAMKDRLGTGDPDAPGGDAGTPDRPGRGSGPTGPAWAQTALGLGVFQTIRGMPVADEEAKLRYMVAGPGVRPRGMSVDEFGMQLSEVGRAMHYARTETLQAAVAYNRLAGTVGEQLVPEMKTLTEASRYNRMELNQAAEYFGSMRRMTRADDPEAMRMIATTVRATLESAGPYRRDEVRDALRSLAGRSTRGMPEGLTADSMLLHGVLAETLNRTGVPGLQGDAGADVLGRAFQLQFNADDPTSVMRMRMLQGRPDLLNGNIFNVLGGAREQLERISHFQWTGEDVDAIFQMVQRSQALAGGASLSKAGAAEALRRVGGFGNVTAHEMDALAGSLLGGGQDAFRAEMERLRERRAATDDVGPQRAQRDSAHMANQESRRKIQDALGTLGRYGTEARNLALEATSDYFGGGATGDMAALALNTATQFGMLYGGFSTLRRVGGSMRRSFGGGMRGPRFFGGARGTGTRGMFGGWNQPWRLQRLRSRLGPRVGLASRLRYLRRRVVGPNAGGISAVASAGAFALGGHLGNLAESAEGYRRSDLLLGSAGSQIAGYALMGGAMGGPAGAGAGAALGTVMNLREIAEGYATGGSFTGRASVRGFDPVGLLSRAVMYPYQLFKEHDTRFFKPDVDAKMLAESEHKSERMTRDAAAIKLMKELYGDRYGDAIGAYQSSRDRVKPGTAMYEASEFMKDRGFGLSEAQREKLSRFASKAEAARPVRGSGRSTDINVNINVTGNKEIGQAAGDRVAQAIREQGIAVPDEELGEPIHSTWSVGGGLA